MQYRYEGGGDWPSPSRFFPFFSQEIMAFIRDKRSGLGRDGYCSGSESFAGWLSRSVRKMSFRHISLFSVGIR